MPMREIAPRAAGLRRAFSSRRTFTTTVICVIPLDPSRTTLDAHVSATAASGSASPASPHRLMIAAGTPQPSLPAEALWRHHPRYKPDAGNTARPDLWRGVMAKDDSYS